MGLFILGCTGSPLQDVAKEEKQESNPFFSLGMVAYGFPICMALQPITPVDIALVLSSVFKDFRIMLR
jgi:hypothetical protein